MTWFSRSSLTGNTSYVLVLFLGLALLTSGVQTEAIPVELRQTDAGWQPFLGGEPFFIRGNGGDAHLRKRRLPLQTLTGKELCLFHAEQSTGTVDVP